MKVYDTDEAAVAKAARQKMLVKVITVALMLLMSGFGIWMTMKFLNRNDDKTTSLTVPITVAFTAQGEIEPLLPQAAAA